MSFEYDTYLTNHIQNVGKGAEFFILNLPELLYNDDGSYFGRDLSELVKKHDSSKYDVQEYEAYDEYFYGNKTPDILEDFDRAWLHHIHHNPHHWQYWILNEDEGAVKCLEIPYKYLFEMICDWWAFSWDKNDLNEIFSWYDNHKNKIKMHKKSRKVLEYVLKRLKETISIIK